MRHLLDATAKGVYAISATPFTDAGEIDWASLDSLIDFYLQCGVSGLTILGMMGEAQKLSEEESAEFTRRYLRRVDGRVPVIVGVSNPGTANLVRLSRTAMEAGACGVMVAPLTGLKTEAQILAYFSDVISMLGDEVPVVYQDYPQSTQAAISGPELPENRRRAPERGDVQARGLPRPAEAHAGAQGLRREDEAVCQHPGRQRRVICSAGAAPWRRRRHDRFCLSRDAGLGMRVVPERARRGSRRPVRYLPAAGET